MIKAQIQTRIHGPRFSGPVFESMDIADPIRIRVQNGSDLFFAFWVILYRIEIAVKLYSLANDNNLYKFTSFIL